MSDKPKTILHIDTLSPGLARLTLVYESLPGQVPCRVTGERAERAMASWCGAAFASYIETDSPALASLIRDMAASIPIEPEDEPSDAN